MNEVFPFYLCYYSNVKKFPLSTGGYYIANLPQGSVVRVLVSSNLDIERIEKSEGFNGFLPKGKNKVFKLRNQFYNLDKIL